MCLYFISGLGADERVFQFLNLPGIDKKFIKWIEPAKAETLQEYCKRLASQIDPNKKVILIGISFGGIVAQEISKIIKCEKVIIISSIKSEREFSWQLSFVRASRLHKLFPQWLLKWSNKLTADYYFSTESKNESALLHQIIKDTDDRFMNWAIDQILRWKTVESNCPLVHIHGSEDRIFPIRTIKEKLTIDRGGHFMIVNRADQISKIIMDEIVCYL